MKIQSRPPIIAPTPKVAPVYSGVNESLDFLSQVEAYAAQPDPPPAPLGLLEIATVPSANWPGSDQIAAVLATAVTNVREDLRTGPRAINFDAETRRDITTLQHRQAAKEGSPTLERMVHRKQLHGGAAEIHWNRNFDGLIKLFGSDTSKALIRFSDASNEANPDGPSMYGMAIELEGSDGQASDILLTGGSEKTEVSQARDPEAQLALFNMINIPSKLKGLARIAHDVGPVSGLKMLRDVKQMRTDLSSLTQLTAWSRAPFALKGKDGQEYLVKMRTVPATVPQPQPTTGGTSSEKLRTEFQQQLRQSDLRWRLEFQFMQPGDDPYDAREAWNGPWLTAGELVLPQITDDQEAQRQSERAENTKFSVWKNKQEFSEAADKDVLRPWGEMNRARLAAYGASGSNRKCPLGYG